MSYVCTSFSEPEDWTFGERHLTYNFSFAAGNILTIGFTGNAWISPFSSSWNISTTFSLIIRNDTGRINSSPRAITAPVIRVQEGCNHTFNLAVNDPDGDIVRCRWAEGRECAGICSGIYAYLYYNTCVIEYRANRGIGYKAVAIMIEDFLPESSTPLSSVALQFLVLVVSSSGSCSQKPVFILPTIRHGSCVAIPPDSTFITQLIAQSSNPEISITEIQTVPPLGTRVEELTQVANSTVSYVNVSWTPTINQQNQTHLFCFTAVGSDRIAGDQTCIDLLPGHYPPEPISSTAYPNNQLVFPSNTTFQVTFNMAIVRPSLSASVSFHEFHSDQVVYNIDASNSSTVLFEHTNILSFTPTFVFEEKMRFYITFERGVVQGTEQCGPGNEPLMDKHFWTFQVMDLTAPVISFLENPYVTSENISLSWESNENVTWECTLSHGTSELSVECSQSYWKGYGLNEGNYSFIITATDEAGNIATVTHTFEVDLTPPTVLLVIMPNLVSNEQAPTFASACNEICITECRLISNMTMETTFSCNSSTFATPVLQSGTHYTLVVIPIDVVGHRGEAVSFMWETDFESPRIFGLQNLTANCTKSSPEYTGQPQASDNRPEFVSLNFHDIKDECSILRTWIATDRAGNTAQLAQNIDLQYSPSISLLPQVYLPCDSASTSFQVSNQTAEAPNPCELPLGLTNEDSEYVCPGRFVRNWTVSVCRSITTASQTLVLYDLCPSHACGRNESIPRGTCSYGICFCNRPFYGEDCDTIIYEPASEQVDNAILQEAEMYMKSVIVSQGTPPLSWSIISGPEQLSINPYTGVVSWRRAQVGYHSVVVQIDNQVGSTQVEWNLQVIPGYNATLSPLSSEIFPYAQPVLLTGYIEYLPNNLIQSEQDIIIPVYIDIIDDASTIGLLSPMLEAMAVFQLSFILQQQNTEHTQLGQDILASRNRCHKYSLKFLD